MNANVKFFLELATNKVAAKLQAVGYTAGQAAEFITRPGHMVDILNLAQDLHMQAIDAVLDGRIVAA